MREVALVAHHTIVGYMWEELSNWKNAATISLSKFDFLDNFKFKAEQVDCTDWFTNIPKGLKAIVNSTAQSGESVSIVFYGMPREMQYEQIRGHIPSSAFITEDIEGYITSAIQFSDAFFDIRFRWKEWIKHHPAL